MKKTGFLLAGILSTGTGIEFIITGDTWFDPPVPHSTFDEDPVGYCLELFLWFGIGIGCLYESFKGD